MKKAKTLHRRHPAKTPWWPKINKAQGHENLRFRSHARDLRPVSEKELFAAEAKNKKT